MLSQEDIARELNVSPSLVSKVLNNRLGTSRVSRRTLEAIRRRAEEKNYRKNGPAVALATGRQGVIGVFIHRIGLAGSGLTEAVLEGITEASLTTGSRIMLQFFETAQTFRSLSPQFQPALLDGMILSGLLHSELRNDLIEIQSRGIRVVTLVNEAIAPGILNVGLDQREVGRIPTAHLIQRGCKRIAHIAVIDARRAGYEAALDAARIPRRPELVFVPPPEFKSCSFDTVVGRLAVEYFAKHNIDFDGLTTQSDHQAIGAMNALIHMGRRVPQDVKIVGVDDSPLCEVAHVGLSSVSQEFRRRGHLAMEAMLETSAKPALPKILPVLHARESSA